MLRSFWVKDWRSLCHIWKKKWLNGPLPKMIYYFRYIPPTRFYHAHFLDAACWKLNSSMKTIFGFFLSLSHTFLMSPPVDWLKMFEGRTVVEQALSKKNYSTIGPLFCHWIPTINFFYQFLKFTLSSNKLIYSLICLIFDKFIIRI